jgi:general secretion pathway protein E
MAEIIAEANRSANNETSSFPEHLVRTGKLSELALDRARRGAGQTGEPLIPLLSRLGLFAERDLAAELAAFYRVSPVSAQNFPGEALYADRINQRFLKLHRILPLAEAGDSLIVAMADPGDDAAIKAIGYFSGKPVIRRVATLTDIESAIDRLYSGGGKEDAQPVNQNAPAEQDNDDIDRLADLASEAPVIRLVHGLITDAVQAGASDIHFEPFVDRLRIRFRIDGMLQERETQPRRLAAAVVSRIKIMARLNIAERRLPQDGSLRFTVLGRDVDIRVSSSPTVHGESVVLRILDRDAIALDFHALGFDDPILKPLLELLRRPNGIILVTGPTGSGKTTTLYTALLTLNTADKKILTVEDPIEYKLDGINQQEVLPQIHRTFASALRSFLRQDPDILMVGEIRDSETARTAVQASLTGHLVLSTLHTNDAASAVTRLLDMGIENYLLASTVCGILAQRLVRKLCVACRQAYTPVPELTARLFAGFPALPGRTPTLYRAKGCPACRGTGFHGRTTIIEQLTVDDEICRLILRKADAQEIQRAASARGMRSMYQHGMVKALAGETTFEEVLRVTQEA